MGILANAGAFAGSRLNDVPQLQIQPGPFGDQFTLLVNDANHAGPDGAAAQQAYSDGLVGHALNTNRYATNFSRAPADDSNHPG